MRQAPIKHPGEDELDVKMARLYPKYAAFERSGVNIAPWLREDAPTIAAAIGLYASGAAARRVPTLLLRLRGWPSSLGWAEVQEIRRHTSRLLADHVAPDGVAVPPTFRRDARKAIETGLMPLMLLTELVTPVDCGSCHGKGWVKDERCETCAGSGDGNIGVRTGAARLNLSAHQWKSYGRPGYLRVLAAYRYMATMAMRGVLEALG